MAATVRMSPKMRVVMSRGAQQPTYVDNSPVARPEGQGVPTGSALSDAKERGPKFLLWAVRDLSHELNLVGSPPTNIHRQMTNRKPSAKRHAELELCQM